MHPVITQSNERADLSETVWHNTRLFSPPEVTLPTKSQLQFLQKTRPVKRQRHRDGTRWPVWCGEEGFKLHRSAYLKNMCKHSCNYRHTGGDTNTRTCLTHMHINISRVSTYHYLSQCKIYIYIQTVWFADMEKWQATLSQLNNHQQHHSMKIQLTLFPQIIVHTVHNCHTYLASCPNLLQMGNRIILMPFYIIHICVQS